MTYAKYAADSIAILREWHAEATAANRVNEIEWIVRRLEYFGATTADSYCPMIHGE